MTWQLFPTEVCLSPLKNEFSKGSINCRIIMYKLVRSHCLKMYSRVEYQEVLISEHLNMMHL